MPIIAALPLQPSAEVTRCQRQFRALPVIVEASRWLRLIDKVWLLISVSQWPEIYTEALPSCKSLKSAATERRRTSWSGVSLEPLTLGWHFWPNVQHAMCAVPQSPAYNPNPNGIWTFGQKFSSLRYAMRLISVKCNIGLYIWRLCYDVSVRLSVRLSVCLWRKCIGAL